MKALPILIDLFRSPQCHDRDSVAHLIACIANGRGYYQVHSRLEKLRPNYEERLRAEGSSIDEQIAEEEKYLAAIKEIAIEILPLLEPYLDSPEPTIRESIASTMGRYADHFRHYKGLLMARLSIENNEDVRRHIEMALSEIEEAQQTGCTEPGDSAYV